MKRNRIANSGVCRLAYDRKCNWRVGACGVEIPDALTKVVAAPYVVALIFNLQNGADRGDAARYLLTLVLCTINSRTAISREILSRHRAITRQLVT